MTPTLLPHPMGETGVELTLNRLRLEGWGYTPKPHYKKEIFMAHIIKGERAEKKSEKVIYVIIFPTPEKKLYIGQTGVNRLRKTYTEHIKLRVTKTAKMFTGINPEQPLPPIYELERGLMSAKESFSREVAWMKYFLDHGFEQATKDRLTDYSQDILGDTETHYNYIRQKKLSDVLLPEGGLYPDYSVTNRNAKGTAKGTKVTMLVTSDEYLQIKNAAKENNLSMTMYCKKMVLNGRIIHADLSFMGQLMTDYKQSKVMLQQIMHNIYVVGEYLPADMVNIQKSVDHITDIHLEMIKKICELIETLTN